MFKPLLALLLLHFLTFVSKAQELQMFKKENPIAIVDLKTQAGASQLQVGWLFKTCEIAPAIFNEPGPDKSDSLFLYPTGKKISTFKLFPSIQELNDSKIKWTSILPTELEKRKGNGLLSFNWYKTNLTKPSKIGNHSTDSLKIIFEIVADDYSEVYINGNLSLNLGKSGEGVISGWNTRNRIDLTEEFKNKSKIEIAVLVANGPFGNLPQNYCWIRSATVSFYKDSKVPKEEGSIIYVDNSLEKVIVKNSRPKLEATGFQFAEGPFWHPDGYLLFSDPNANTIFKLNPTNKNVTVYLPNSGYTGLNIGNYHQPGSNGLAIDSEGRLIICQHGNRSVIRLEKKGPVTKLATHYKNMKLNSPNDLVIRKDGTIFFTDPPYGLPDLFNDKGKETPFSGVYAISKGKVKLLTTDFRGPNGIAFSPDEKYLYVSNWDINDIRHTKFIYRYNCDAEGNLSNRITFADMNNIDNDLGLDGLDVDELGNVYSSAPDGIWIINPDGKLIGKIILPEHASNITFGGKDNKTLYITATSSIYSIDLLVSGAVK